MHRNEDVKPDAANILMDVIKQVKPSGIGPHQDPEELRKLGFDPRDFGFPEQGAKRLFS